MILGCAVGPVLPQDWLPVAMTRFFILSITLQATPTPSPVDDASAGCRVISACLNKDRDTALAPRMTVKGGTPVCHGDKEKGRGHDRDRGR